LLRSPEFLVGRRVARGDVTGNHLLDRDRRRRPIADDPAVGPFDSAIAGRQAFVRNDSETALEAAGARDLLDLFLRGLEDSRRDLQIGRASCRERV